MLKGKLFLAIQYKMLIFAKDNQIRNCLMFIYVYHDKTLSVCYVVNPGCFEYI